MFKNHPKGLLAASLANMGERFGFYTMMAILSLFLMTKFGLNETNAGIIYSVFYASIYLLALVGGLIADKTRNYKGIILLGLLLMTLGYVIISIPTATPVPSDKFGILLALSCFGLLIIAFGNGMFKGNLQALVGQMYDNPQYSKMRDSGFQLFYMFINVGAIFAPFLAVGVRNWWVEKNGYLYNADLPTLAHQYLGSTITSEGTARLQSLASEAGFAGTDLATFSSGYLNVFTTGFHYAFAVAIVAMLVSLVIYLFNKNRFPDPANKQIDSANAAVEEMDIKEVKQRLYALFAVFAVVIFFWFSFHQNGLTLTYFAKDYTDLSQIKLNLGFVTLQGAEIFQSINPFFVVFLTPIIVGFFGWLRAKGKEPSTPRKIAIGMGIAALAYVVMAIGSVGLPLKSEVDAMGGLADSARVTPWLLIGTYFILTVAELFISPLGISFVSKVAPPKLQGIMQGAWLGATAIGNSLLFIGAIFYANISMTATWLVFVSACVISMFTMLGMLKWLERIAK
ncbi:proton-dependent oligopeptide transporter, POT family [Porphyromonadaceae bacterium NLAE-zl-C104]|uniref:peptide MFS transporter n=1 Tax=Proteiniphilum saccharofermentans TaxID=1642647 RepID=UPI000894B8BA|nr:peptide MFS transporter [Proteiniphilum saccharofermentans]SEA22541.1 proton-dependent oligopeptide transporter, POT family [Porphyromonadaceae bacterium KH3R12]SFS81396.1 proton-dependent oligopeptide transporter, POT family [Porphyromonadaceae bacterium NLAE-zl-C104]